MRAHRVRRPNRILQLAVLVLAIVFVAGCSRPDSTVKANVEEQLARDPVLAPLGLTVSVSRGVVFLAGETQTVEQQARATEIARSVAGVSDVVSEIELDENAPLVDAVRRALAADPLLASVPIEVDAESGVVRLMSDATDREQRQRAVAVARGVEGVVEVEDRMK